MNKLSFLKIYSTVMGAAPDIIFRSRFAKLVYNLWRIFLIAVNMYTIDMYVAFLRDQIKVNFSDKRKLSLQPFVQIVFVLQPLVAYCCIGCLRLLIFLINLTNFMNFKEKCRNICDNFLTFFEKYPELRAGYFKISKMDIIYCTMMVVSLSRDIAIAYAVEGAVRQISVRPWYKTVTNFLKALLTEINSIDTLSLLVLFTIEWLTHCISYLNTKLNRILQNTREKTQKKRSWDSFSVSGAKCVIFYQESLQLWSSIENILGSMIFLFFLLWMVTLNFSTFFAISTNTSSGRNWRWYRATAQINSGCVLLRFVFIDNVGHNLEKIVSLSTG